MITVAEVKVNMSEEYIKKSKLLSEISDCIDKVSKDTDPREAEGYIRGLTEVIIIVNTVAEETSSEVDICTDEKKENCILNYFIKNHPQPKKYYPIHGRWETLVSKSVPNPDSDGYVSRVTRCSVCLFSIPGWNGEDWESEFCPHCGAMMNKPKELLIGRI